jgi:hypothetical protein
MSTEKQEINFYRAPLSFDASGCREIVLAVFFPIGGVFTPEDAKKLSDGVSEEVDDRQKSCDDGLNEQSSKSRIDVSDDVHVASR